MTLPDLPEPMRAAIERIRDDRDHGASWLAREAASALAEASVPSALGNDEERLERLRLAARTLATTRPSMAALSNTVAHIWSATRTAGGAGGETSTASARLRALHDAAEAQLRAWDEASVAIYQHARPLLRGVLFSHSRSGTVEHVLSRYAAEQRGPGTKGATHPALWLTESRPGGEGVALARALAPAGWQITLIADAAVGMFVREAAAVVVGADSIRADGGIVNKVGTYPLALAAQRAGVPMYVLAESVKLAAPSAPLVLEAMDPRELLPDPVLGISARNPYFELTPAELVTATISERGRLSLQDIAAIAREAESDLAFLLSG
jgi:ribose 1,5-bisphosphate isomerase